MASSRKARKTKECGLYGCYNTKKKPLFQTKKTRKKSSSTATSLWTLSVRGSQMASGVQKTFFFWGGGRDKKDPKKNVEMKRKREMQKEEGKIEKYACVFRESSSSSSVVFFFCRTIHFFQFKAFLSRRVVSSFLFLRPTRKEEESIRLPRNVPPWRY